MLSLNSIGSDIREWIDLTSAVGQEQPLHQPEIN